MELKPFEQPKWFTDAEKTGAVQGVVSTPAPKVSIEDRVTALEELLDLHGIRPK